MSEVLALLQLLFHQGTADTGVAVSVNAETEPRARDADLGGVAPLHHSIVSVTPFLHRLHESFASTDVLALARLGRQCRCASPIVISIPG